MKYVPFANYGVDQISVTFDKDINNQLDRRDASMSYIVPTIELILDDVIKYLEKEEY